MKIITEYFDNEYYIDFVLEPSEVDNMHDESIHPVTIDIFGKPVNFWIRTATQRELYEDDE